VQVLRGTSVTPSFAMLAIVDFTLFGTSIINPGGTGRTAAYAQSELRVLEPTIDPSSFSSPTSDEDLEPLKSACCPRFVPSGHGEDVLFVAESSLPAPSFPTYGEQMALHPQGMPSRRLARVHVPTPKRMPGQPEHDTGILAAQHATESDATRNLPEEAGTTMTDSCCTSPRAECFACQNRQTIQEFCAVPSHSSILGCRARQCCIGMTAQCLACHEGKSLEEFCGMAAHKGVVGCEARDPHSVKGLEVLTMTVKARFLDIGVGQLPAAPVRGCPEFMPSLYINSKSISETLSSNLFTTPQMREQAQLAETRLRDTFIFISDPSSNSVIGVDAQVLAVSLPEGRTSSTVNRVNLLYNVDNAPNGGYVEGANRLRLIGCQPIRAAGRQGHMRLQWVLETLMQTFRIKKQDQAFSAWLACLTADQRIAIVESPARDRWINMSMPYPMWTGKASQAMWCRNEREQACFEVWSNPNPNE